MATINPQGRAALQSARAKNRKAAVILGTAAAEHGVSVPKHVIAKITALNEWYDLQLASKSKTADSPDAAAEAVAA